MTDNIFNGERGDLVRAKLNEVIDRTNALMGVENHGSQGGNPHGTKASQVTQTNTALGANVQTALDELERKQSADNSNNNSHSNNQNNPHNVSAEQVSQNNPDLGDDVQEALNDLHGTVVELVEMMPEKADLDHIDGLDTHIQLRRGTNPLEAWNDDLMVAELFLHYTKGQLWTKLNDGTMVMIGSQKFIEDAPEDGYTYGREDGQWVRVGATEVGDDRPENPVLGTLWYDTGTTAELYVWDGYSWVSVTGAGGGGSEAADNVVLDDATPEDRNVALAREIDTDGEGVWRPIYTSDLVTENNQPMLGARADASSIRNQQQANMYLLERIEEAGIPVIISDQQPDADEHGIKDGSLWFDNSEDVMQLFLWHEESDAWIPVSPPTTLEGRVDAGEATQAAIIEQIQESLIEQETLKNKVSALEGAIGEHSLLFTSTNQNPREGEFNLKNSEYRTVTYLSEAGFITLNGTDRDGNTINLSRIVVGDVLRLSDISRQVAELQVTQITDGNIFTFENLSGDLERFSEGPYDFILLSAFDPAGLATISYVDERDGTKLGKAANNVIDNNFRISRSDGAIYWNTSGGDLTLSRLKTPTSSHHAVNKAYVDEALMEQAYISARPPGVKFMYQPGSSDLNEMSFQWFQSDSRLRISAKGVDIDWLADGFTHDYNMSNGPYFTIWYMPSIANVNDRPQWKVRKHGRIDRIDWHKDDILCYISSSKSNANFSDGATYYITIGGIL